MTNRQTGLLAVALSIAGYAALPILTRIIYRVSALQPTDIAIWRFVFATPAIWLVILLRENRSQTPRKRDSSVQILRMMALGILYTGAALSAFFGLQYIPAGLYSVLFYTYPALVALIGVLLGQRLPLLAWLAIALSLIGVVLTVPDLSIAGENTGLGISIALLNAIFVAIYFVIISREMPKVSTVSRGAAYVITGTLLILILLIPFFGLRLPDNNLVWLLMITLATWSTAMPIFIINIAIQKLGVTQVTVISTSEPIATLVLSMIILNEAVLVMQWLGAAFIIGGVVLLELKSKPKIITN